MSVEQLAKIAYDAYADCAGKDPDFRGTLPAWDWDLLDGSIRQAWIAAAEAVRKTLSEGK